MISDDEVKNLATLARLELDPALIPVVTGHLNSILGYVQRLDQVDTTGVEAMSHVHGSTNVLREDQVLEPGSVPEATPLGDSVIPPQPMLDTEALLKNAPDASGTYIRVPLIVE
jgi:aspartyl-tRNA(Asn)/glutamyl-tRNA(Gln) amidotransferase subunit C